MGEEIKEQISQEEELVETSENKVIRDDKGRVISGTPNPNGRPKGTLSLVSLLKEKLKEVDPQLKKTYAEIFITKALKKAIQDEDVPMMRDLLNRVDGMPKQSFGFDDDNFSSLKVEIVKSNGEETLWNNSFGEERPGEIKDNS